MKEGFWTFLEGTHPRLGEDSAVRLLAGQTPVIKLIRDYSLHQPQLCQQLVNVEDQITQILRFLLWNYRNIFPLPFYRLCRIRSILLEIANIERQPLWAIGNNKILNYIHLSSLPGTHYTAGACSLCADGGDCITGSRRVMEDNKDQPLEIFLRDQNPHIFFMLNFALKKVLGRSEDNFKTALKSLVLEYM